MRARRRTDIVARTFVSALLGAAVWMASPVSADSGQASAKKTAARVDQRRANPAPLRREERRRLTPGESRAESVNPGVFAGQDGGRGTPDVKREPHEHHMQRAESFDGDVRGLPQDRPLTKRERPEREGPDPAPRFAPGTSAATETAPPDVTPAAPGQSLPTPGNDFDGLDFNTWGNGHPPDTNGDVGPSYFIETINTAIGIFDKSTGGLVTALSFNTFMSQGHFGNLCDTNNFGDPVVLYDTFEDRWVITDFAFQLDGFGNVINPPGAFECFAVSKTSDPTFTSDANGLLPQTRGC
jgi:hypothetical protein